MLDDDIQPALAFHDATKYYALSGDDPSDDRIGIGDPAAGTEAIWQKDWDIKPLLYKVYETAPSLELGRDLPGTGRPALESISAVGTDGAGVPDRALLGRLGLLTNGSLDRTWTSQDGRTSHFRTAGGTGAMYHLELYFVCGELADLAAGVYHYSAIDHSLRLLRTGDFRAALVDATGDLPAVATAPVVLALTSTFWRNAWRYRERAYRHVFWDAGTSLSHILAVSASSDVSTELVFGYADRLVNDLLGVDGERESTVALVALGHSSRDTTDAPSIVPPIDRLDLPTRRLSPAEVTFHAITDLHRASSLSSGDDAAAWRARRWARPAREPLGELVELRPTAGIDPSPVEQTILRRRSTRKYDPEVAIGFEAFSTLLDRSTRGVASDVLVPGSPLTELYLIVNAVEGLAPGVYRHHPSLGAVELMEEGNFREQATRIAAIQSYAGLAHVNLYYLADLPAILEHHGPRGYRLAQLEGALHAGKLHLGTHTMGLGAVGSTSFDDEVVKFFSPAAAGLSYMFVTVFGKRRPKRA